MSFQFYSELRESLPKHDSKTINPETLRKLFQLFTRERKIFGKYETPHPSYPERYLFATLEGYTSRQLFMSRLSVIECKYILLLSDILTNHITKTIRYHDFTSMMAVGSSTYSEKYWNKLQQAVDDINYIAITKEKETYEDRNTSYESITKKEIQETINKRGNDIDLVLTGFLGGKIALQYMDYYRDNISLGIQNKIEKDEIKNIVESFIYKDTTEEDFLKFISLEDKKRFFDMYNCLQNNNEYGVESRSNILLSQHKMYLTKKGKDQIKSMSSNEITHFITTKKVIKEKDEYIRDQYLQEIIPLLLQKNNIPYTIQTQREDGSYYYIDNHNKTITKQKYLNPNHHKEGCIIIQFPECRPIHLNVDTSTIEELYHHERKEKKSFVLLTHEYIEREEFLTTDRKKDIIIPEEVSLEESIAYIRSKKLKIDREKIIQKHKGKKEETEYKRGRNLDSENRFPI